MSERKLRVLVTGASGLIGGALGNCLAAHGHTPIAMERGVAAEPPCWDIERGEVDLGGSLRFDAVVHLAGENIAGGRWSAAHKRRIRESRVQGTKLIAAALSTLPDPPAAFVCASAVGIYGDRGDEVLTEDSAPGAGFLAETGRAWEEATQALERAGTRVVHARFGVVLSPRGGALRKMLPAFKLGLGGPLGSGRQWMSWIALEDAAEAIVYAIESELRGPVNVTAPNPVTNGEFARTLGSVLRRPAAMPVPAFVLRLLFGEMADEALLASARVVPERLVKSGFEFRRPQLREAFMMSLRGAQRRGNP